MKVYLSGPMTGYPNHNREAFDAAEAAIVKMGHKAVNPATLDHNAGIDLTGTGWEASDEEYEGFLARDLQHLADPHISAIVFLPGWTKSGGAGREGFAALKLKLRMFTWHPEEPNVLFPLTGDEFLDKATTKRLTPDDDLSDLDTTTYPTENTNG